MPFPELVGNPVRRLTSSAVNGAWAWARRRGSVRAGDPVARRFGSLGAGSWLAFPPGDHLNPHAVHIGADCYVGEGVTLAVGLPIEVFPPDCEPVIVIGDRTIIGKGSFVVARERVEIEADVTLAPNVYITDHSHTYADPWLPVGQQLPHCEPVRVGAGTWIATNVVVLPGADIGRNCAIAAGAVVRGTIPDHSLVAGVPGRVLRRWTPSKGWQPPLPREAPRLDGWPVGQPPVEG